MTAEKVMIITGSSDGIGAAAARRLQANGHRVVVVGRSEDKTRAMGHELGADYYVADFSRLEEVRSLAATLSAAYPRIDVLANNAGGVFGDPAKTVDGFEKTFQINHLAPFLLTRLLLDRLVSSRATVLQTSSVGARMAGKLDLDDLDHDRRFSPVRAYSAAKLENILFTKELHRRFHGEGVSAVAFHPGSIASGFGTRSDSRLMRFITTNPISRAVVLATPDTGGSRLAWFAESRPGVDWEPGNYYEKRTIKRTNSQAYDADLARRLWDRSEQLVR